MVILHVLGQCLIRTGVAAIGPRAELGFALATRLIADRGRRLARRELTALFWPDADEPKAAHSLSEALHRLRARGIPVESDPSQAVWIPREAAVLDVEGIPHTPPAELAKCDFTVLPGFEPRGSSALIDWADEFRHQLRMQTVRNLGLAIARAEEASDWANSLALSEHVLRLDPDDSDALSSRARAAEGLRSRRTIAAPPSLSTVSTRSNRIGHAATVQEPAPGRCGIPSAPNPRTQGAFVGREEELRVLRDAWEQATRGRGRRVRVHGSSGMGKTRLIRQFSAIARRAGSVVSDVACEPGDVRRPLSVFMRLVPRLRALPGAAGCTPEMVPFLDRLTQYDSGDTNWPEAGDVPYMLNCVERAIVELIGAVADEQPLVIAIDNAQWTDEESARLLEAISLSASTQAVLLIAAACEGTPWSQRPECALTIPIAVGALADTEARQLVLDRAGGQGPVPDDALVDWLVRAGEGNPLRLEELVSHWRSGGTPFELPPSLAALLKSRLAALTSNERRVLQIVALLGRQASLERVLRVATLDQASFLEAVEALEAAGLLITERQDCAANNATTTYTHVQCRHDALARTVIDELSPAARALLHRQIAATLDTEASRSADVLWDRATHWAASDEPADVVRTTIICTRHLAAVGLADAGSAACRQLLNEPLPAGARRDTLTALAHTLHLGWRWTELQEVVRQLRELDGVEDVHDDVELCLLDARWQTQDNAESTLRAAMHCAAATDATPAHRVRATEIAIKLATNAGRLSAIHKAFGQVAGVLNEADAGDRVSVEMMYHAVGGSLPLAEQYARALIRMSARFAEPSRLRALVNCAAALARAGAIDEALTLCERATHDAVRRGLAPLATAACHRATNISLDAGDIDAATQWLERFAAHGPADDPRRQKAIQLAAARVDFHARRLDSARLNLLADGVPLWRDASPAFAAMSLATAIAVTAACGRDALSLRALLARVLPLHRRLEGMGAHDFVAFAIASGYEHLGEHTRAATLLHRYLTQQRRELLPVPEPFTALVSQPPGL